MSDACPGNIKYGSRHALQGQASGQGVVLTPSSCGTDLGSVRLNVGRSVFIKGARGGTLFFPLGIDALAHSWPHVLLYAFPPLALLLATLTRVREHGHTLILIESGLRCIGRRRFISYCGVSLGYFLFAETYCCKQEAQSPSTSGMPAVVGLAPISHRMDSHRT